MQQMPENCAVAGPNPYVLELLDAMLEDRQNLADGDPAPIEYAEIGVYQGDTAFEVAKKLPGESQIHLFDFKNRLNDVFDRFDADKTLSERDVTVRFFSNTDLLFDSYNWALAKRVMEGQLYDFVFIDGAHTWHHDGFAYLLLDRMLKDGGVIVFDDYSWSLQTSPTMNPENFPEIAQQYTGEQISAQQVKMVVDLLVKPDPSYQELIPNVAYQKVPQIGD